MDYNLNLKPMNDPRIEQDAKIGYSYCIYCGGAFRTNQAIFLYAYPGGAKKKEKICNYCQPPADPQIIDEADYYEDIEDFYADERD